MSELDSAIMVDSMGQEPTVQKLFRPEKHIAWMNMKPGDEILQATEDEKHALILRHEKDKDQNMIKLAAIVVQSPYLKELLAKIMEGFMGISFKLRKVEFLAPFHAFYYRWEAYQKAIDALQDEVAIQHAQLLHPIISKEVGADLNAINDLISHGLISHEHLWAIFEPDRDLYTKDLGDERLFKITEVEYRSSDFLIGCNSFDTDGKSFGSIVDYFRIPEFKGIRKIVDLPYVPADHFPTIKELRSRLRLRGARFRDFIGIHHVNYSGTYVLAQEEVQKDKRQTRTMRRGRVIIDAEAYYAKGFEEGGCLLKQKSSSLTGDLAYCINYVRGYSLTTKEWGTFSIDQITAVDWADNPLDRLIVSSDWKEILLSFMNFQSSHEGTSMSFDDVIKGKGKGMILLLAGTPGTGKTSTVESIAEHMRLPLYSMSLGELGTSPSKVEGKLREHMENCSRWGAVLLLDECDIFLAKRDDSEVVRSIIVSVFLKAFEYFQGTMFLTTNRAESLDPAFESRIDFTLQYPSLDFDSRMQIWKNFVRDSSTEDSSGDNAVAPPYQSSLSEADISRLARLEVNGRVIKNIVKAATLLAARKNQPLSIEDVETILRVKGLLAIDKN